MFVVPTPKKHLTKCYGGGVIIFVDDKFVVNKGDKNETISNITKNVKAFSSFPMALLGYGLSMCFMEHCFFTMGGNLRRIFNNCLFSRFLFMWTQG